jgi:hypothetical protein
MSPPPYPHKTTLRSRAVLLRTSIIQGDISMAKSSGQSTDGKDPAGYPSTTGKPSGGGRDNGPKGK